MDVTAGEPRRRPYAQLSSKRPWIILLVLLLLAGTIWGAYALTQSSKSGGPGGGFGRRGGRPPTTVGVASAGIADVPVTMDALGTVTPTATITVRPQVSGTIVQVLFKEGQLVKRGQALAVIDPRPLQMALMQAQGQLTRDQAQLANAQLTLGRYKTLLAQDSIARQDVDTQAATVKQLEGVVTSDKASLGTARLNLGYSRVTAPVSGRVGLRAVDVGNVISAGDANGLVVLTEVAPIDVEFTVPQDQAPRIMQRSARAVLPVTALDRSRSAPLAQGAFSTLDNQVDPTTGTIRAKARFSNADGALFPNQFVNVRMTLDTLQNAIVVPLTALRTGPNGDFVWVVKADQTVTQRPVTKGQTTATTAVIASGLQPCERVVTEGGDRLTEGGKILLPGQGGGGGRGGRGRGGAGAGGQGASPAGRTPPATPAGGGQAYGGGQRGAGRGAGAGGPGFIAGPGCPGGPPKGAPYPTPGAQAAFAAPGAQPAQGGQGAGGGRLRRGGQAPGGAPQAPGAAPAAQPGQAPAGQGQGGGGFQPTPEMQAARAAVQQACAADMAKLCAGQQGREAFMCLRQNAAKASATCQAAMAKMPRRAPGGGQGGGGPG
jgi:multidrug efflux system membrane fusion protein